MVRDSEMLRQAEADLDAAKAELAAAQEQVKAAQERAQSALARTQEMQSVWTWLQRHLQPEERVAAASAASVSAATIRPTRFGKPVPEVPQTELCLRVLADLGGRSASTKEIRDRLARDGHELSLDQVRATLKYMSKKTPPAVETATGSGIWRLKEGAVAVPLEPVGAPVMNGAGRGS